MAQFVGTIGMPGVGKGTILGNFMKGRENRYGIVAVSDLLKKQIANNTELGQKAKSYMDAGQLVPDDLIIDMVINELNASEKPVFLDGFPRTVPQARAMLEAGIIPAMVVEFHVDEAIILERLRNRIVCPNCNASYNRVGVTRPKVDGICDNCGTGLIRRKDDNEDVVLKRFEVYHTQTYPCLSVFESANIPVYRIDNSDSETARKQFQELMSTL